MLLAGQLRRLDAGSFSTPELVVEVDDPGILLSSRHLGSLPLAGRRQFPQNLPWHLNPCNDPQSRSSWHAMIPTDQ